MGKHKYKRGSPFAAFGRQFERYRSSALKRGLPFCLTHNEIAYLSIKPCHYCGVEPCRIVFPCVKGGLDRSRGVFVNGLDRVDNGDGYSLENVVTCCTLCNGAKSALSLEEFSSWLNRICEYRRCTE